MYITKEDAVNVLQNMQSFELSLKEVYDAYEYNLHENLGRRNILLSNSQEKETAKVLRKKFKEVISDGAPGRPDVVISDINAELECKLTSGSTSAKGVTSYAFYTDWQTLAKKGCLDYNFIVANKDFTEFCYIIFEGLTLDDFTEPPRSARGKAQMNKHKAFKKARFLVGGVHDRAVDYLRDTDRDIIARRLQKSTRIEELTSRLALCSDSSVSKRKNLLRVIENETKRHDKALAKLNDRKLRWTDKSSYSFVFEKIERANVKQHSLFSTVSEYIAARFEKLKSW